MNFCKSLFLFAFCCFVTAAISVHAQGFSTLKTEEGIEVREKGKKILFYQVRPKSMEGKYERAGYVHPLYSLNEAVLTEEMPKDHPHHHGLFWAWHQIIWKNKAIADGWTAENISWHPVDVGVQSHKKGATLDAEVLWKVTMQKEPLAIVRENTRIRVHKAKRKYRAIDFEIKLSALVDSLKLGGSDDAKGYGGFSLRLQLPQDLSFVSQKKAVVPQETPVIAGSWMNMTGSFEGPDAARTGVLVFCLPSPSGQQPWILRKAASMQNVPFPGRTPVALPPTGLVLQYRVIVHDGRMADGEIEKLFQKYVRSMRRH